MYAVGIFFLFALCFTQHSHAATPPDPVGVVCAESLTPESTVPLSYEAWRPEVIALLKTRAHALRLSHSRINRMIAVVDAPENRKYFDQSADIASTLYNLQPGQRPSLIDVTDSLFAVFLRSEEALDTGLTWQRFKVAVTERTFKFSRAVFWIIIGGAILGPVQQLSGGFSAPVLQPLVAEGNAAIFRAYPNETTRPLSPEEQPFHEFFYEAWHEGNARIPLNQREGRSHYYEVVNILLQSDTLLLTLAQHQAPTHTERASLEDLIATLKDQHLIYPDVYQTEYGERVLEPQRNRILLQARQLLLTTSPPSQ